MPTVRRRRRDSLAERRAETKTSAGSSASSSSRARVQFRKLGAKSARVRPTPIATMATSGMRGLNIFIQDIRNAPNKEAEQARVDKELANIRKKFKKIKDMTAYDKKKCVHLAGNNVAPTRRARVAKTHRAQVRVATSARRTISSDWSVISRSETFQCDPRARSIERASGERTKSDLLSPLKPRATTSPSIERASGERTKIPATRPLTRPPRAPSPSASVRHAG